MRILLVAAALAAACAQRGEEEQSAPARLQRDGSIKLSDTDRQALDLAVAVAAEGELPDVAVRFGRVRLVFGEETLVVAPVAGRIVKSPSVQLGSAVKSGTPLLEIVPVLAAAERISVNVQGAQLRGEIEAAQRELATQQAALNRARELARSKIVSEAKLQEADTLVATTRARLEALRRARGAQAPGEGSPIALKAPGEGTVVTLNASLGAAVQQGDLLVRLLRPGPRWVEVSVAPSEPPSERYEVEVGSTWIRGRLVAQGAVVEDDGTRHDRIEVGGADALRLVPGQTVSIRVARGAQRGVLLPESALVPGVQTDLVYIESAAGHYTTRPVKVAARFGGQIRVASGVQAGERVVVRGAMSLLGETRRTELPQAE